MTDIENILREALQEQEEYLFETWSHSDEIDDALEEVYDTVSKTIHLSDNKVIVKNKLSLRIGETEITLFGLNLKLFYFVYIAKDDATADYAIRECYEKNGIDENNQTLIITVYTVNGELLEPISNKRISHELEHLLQISKGKKNNRNFQNLMDLAYEKANNVISNSDRYNNIDLNIAWLYYYSNPHEQDSFVNEYYFDLCWMKEHYIDKNNETRKRLSFYEAKIEWYNENKTKPEVINAVQQYRTIGMPKKNFEVMIKKGLQRFERKIKNVEKHFTDRNKFLKVHHMHNGLKTFHGSLINF